MGKLSGPKYPDPGKTAQQQGAANTSTAITQQLMNMINQQTPDGSLNYNPSGTYSYTDPTTGKKTNLPQFTATTTLSPEQQGLYNQQQQFDKNTNQIALDQTGRIGDMLGQPINLSNEATEGRLMDLGRQRLDPVFQQREDALRQQLQNRGISEGSTAYDNSMQNFNQGRNDAYNNLLLSGRAQSVNEELTKRNQPINETTALMSGGQVQQPNFVNTPNVGVQGTDIAGLQNAAFNAQNSQYMAKLGGIAGVAGAGLGALGGWAGSDRRLKKDIKQVGKLNDGTNIYKYRYKSGGLMQLGVMAQEIEGKHPEVVAKTDDGMRAVNYSALAEALA